MIQHLLKQGLFAVTIGMICTVSAIFGQSSGTNLSDGLYAEIKTSRGSILLELFPDKAPLTVTNFVGLAEGKLEFANKKGFFYDGLKFHRVIADFMIQGGDPLGNGTGGPGYKFPDETDNGLVFDKPGILAMANSGPDTNGSQFFITHVATPWLNAKHTIFGRVVNGQNIVDATAGNDAIKSIRIKRIGKKAKAWTVNSAVFKKLENEILTQRKNAQNKKRKDVLETITKRWPNALLDKETGIYYVVNKKGTGRSPKPGNLVKVHYTGTLIDGTKFDSSRDRNLPFEFNVGTQQVIPGWDYTLLNMKKGEQRTIILPPEMAYGSRGVGPIPPDSWLVFDVELLGF